MTRVDFAASPALALSWANLSAFRSWKPRIEEVVPVVRWAMLVRHTPHLTAEITEQIKQAFDNSWSEWRERYRHVVATKAGVDVASLVIDPKEVVRLRYDGDTPMIDLPKIQTVRDAEFPFDLRNCAALCLKDYSSKFWTRIGLPYEIEHGCAVSDLTTTLKRYRALAKFTAEWFRDELIHVAAPFIDDRKTLFTGALEVTAVGLRVHGQPDQADFDGWLFDDETEHELSPSTTARPNLENDDLRFFVEQAANLEYDARDVGEQEPDAFWMSLPMAVERENGDLASRNALYLVRPVDDVVQIAGVGLDDSRAGDFASEVALKLSRIVANRF